MNINTLLIDETFLPTAQELVENANKSIFISTFKAEFATTPRGRRLIKFFDTVAEKSRRRVDVRFLMTKYTDSRGIPFTNLRVMRELKRHKVRIRCLRSDRTCHAKLIIVDGTTAILGSHNLSVKSCHNNFEISYFTDDKSVVERLYECYVYVWDNAKEV